MIVKTKNYRLEKKTYIRLALRSVLQRQGWIAGLVALALCLCALWVPSICGLLEPLQD